MKTVIITCDTCKKQLYREFIIIGTETGKGLKYENKLPTKPGELISMGHSDDLHFCSKDHFYDYFFNRSNYVI